MVESATKDPVVRQAYAYLQTSPHRPLRSLSCELDNGVLKIRGCLPTFYLKQLAVAELTRNLCGCEIRDLIEVTLPSEELRAKRPVSKRIPTGRQTR